MQFEIPEDVHVHIVIGKPGSAKVDAGLHPGAAGALLAIPGEASAARPAPRFGRFAVGQHFGGSPHTPELARTAVALPRPAPTADQHAFPDRPQPHESPAQIASQLPADFQRQLQQPPTVTPPPGQTILPETPRKNPFGLEN
jgi:hypothetical protein